MSDKKKIIRIAMIPVLTDKLLENQLIYINQLYDVTAVCSKRKGLIEIGKKERCVVFDMELTRVSSPLKI